MLSFQLLVTATVAAAAAIKAPVMQNAPNNKLVPAEASATPTVISAYTISYTTTFTTSTATHHKTSHTSPSITAAPSGPVYQAKADCTPSSICFDGIICGVRYGACYDANYCDGNTSPYAVPTCTS